MTHLCPTCKKEWMCLTEANFGDCDNGEDSNCYDCAGMPALKYEVNKKIQTQESQS